MSRRCVIISAAEINNYEKIKSFLVSEDYFIYCDGGLKHREKLGFPPDLIVGDFDSYDCPENPIFDCSSSNKEKAEIIRLPCEKDDTDTFFAIKEALKRGFSDFLLIGVLGQRFDHSLCNISVLFYLYQQNATCVLLDDYSEIEIIGGKNNSIQIPDSYKYFSIMCFDGNASGITIKNAKYTLENAEIKTWYQYGISNEVLPGKIAEVFVEKGFLLVVKVW